MTATTMENTNRQVPWWVVLLQGIFAIILGILFLTAPGMSLVITIQFLGIYWFISGIFSIVSIFIDRTSWGWKLFSGVLGIIAGVLILQHPLWSTILLPTTLVFVLGIQGIIIGVIALIQAFQGGGWGAGILGALSILFGLVLMANPLVGAAMLPWILGGVGLVGGVIAIIQAFRMK